MTKFFLKMFFCFAIGITIFVSTAWAEIHIAQRPEALPEGKQATRHGDGFTPNGKVIIHDFNPNDDERQYEYFTDENGHFEETFIYQAPEFDVTVGQHYFYAIDFETGNRSQNYMYYEVTEGPVPTIGTGPLEGVAGTPFERWGDGFTPNSTAFLYFYTPDGTEYYTKEIPVTSEGTFSFTSALEIDLSPGVYSWKAVDNSTGLEDTVSFTIVEGDLEGINAEIIFAMDTSGSMSDEFEVLCTRINEVAEGLRDEGINVIPKIFGIYSMQYCTENTVYQKVSNNGANPIVNNSEDWGPAITDLARHYSWTPKYHRIVIPMSDEAAENGGSWSADDDTAASDAIDAAIKNGVIVIPIVCSGSSDKIANEADNIAIRTRGKLFTSEDPAEDLINGIIDAINSSVGGIATSDIWPYCYVDDAWIDPKNTTIHKLPGDIIQLVCQINNNTENHEDVIPVSLTFDYPESWRLVLDYPESAVRVREAMEMNDKQISSQNVSTADGRVTISDIEVPPKMDNKVGRSDDYLIRLVIPKNTRGGAIPIKFKVDWQDPNTVKVRSRKEELKTILVNSEPKRFIMTNRNLLYKRYGCGINNTCNENEEINFLLANVYKLASDEGAYIFYVDWWDLYDDFSGVENDYSSMGIDSEAYNPIRNWDRNFFYSCTSDGDNCSAFKDMSEEEINEVAIKIDEYTHYWADFSGGKVLQHWMVIIGDDQVIPFYRAEDKRWGSPTEDDVTNDYDDWYGSVNKHIQFLAKNDYILTDNIYSDTNYGNSDYSDNMYVGRIVGSLDTINKFISNAEMILDENFERPYNITIASGIGKKDKCDFENSNFRENVSNFGTRMEQEGFFVACQKSGACSESCKNGNWGEGCALGSKDCDDANTWDWNDIYVDSIYAFLFNGHANPFKTSNFKACDIGILDNYPMFFLMGCGTGLSDEMETSDGYSNKLIVDHLFESGVSSLVAQTTITQTSYLNEFINALSLDGTIGESFNNSKNMAEKKVEEYISYFGSTLYGIPWMEFITPAESTDKIRSYLPKIFSDDEQSHKTFEVYEEGDFLQFDLNFKIDDNDYRIENEYGYQFVEIDGFQRLKRAEKPVVPVRVIKEKLPLNATNINVSISASNPISLGPLEIPIFNDYPPLEESIDAPFKDANSDLNTFNYIHNPLWFDIQNSSAKTIVVDMIPVVFNPSDNEALLYKDITVTIAYETDSKGILIDVKLLKSEDGFSVLPSIRNTSSVFSNFDVSVAVKNTSGEEIENHFVSVPIDASAELSTEVILPNVITPGNYFLEVIAFDSIGEIGREVKQFSISPGKITNFDLSQNIVSGGPAFFSVTYLNEHITDIKANFSILFYEGSTFVGETVPMSLDIPVRDIGTADFQWNIPFYFSGEYTAVSKVSFDGISSNSIRSFTVTQKDDCPSDPDKLDPGTCGCGTPDSDSDGDGAPDCIDNCPDDPNRIDGCEPSAPAIVAIAGSNQGVNGGATVSLNGSGSTTGAGITYQWTQTAGPSVALTDANSIQASFTAPDAADGSKTLTFRLTVSDADGNTATDITTVTVSVKDAGKEPDDDHDGPGDTNNCFINSVFH